MTEALRESKERISAIVNTAADAIITIDDRGIIQSVNPATERMFGYNGVEMIGRNVNMLMPSPEREEHDAYMAGYLKTGEKKIIGTRREVQARRKDGSTFPVELGISEFRLNGRRFFAGVHCDITTRKFLQKEVLQVAAQVRVHRCSWRFCSDLCARRDIRQSTTIGVAGYELWLLSTCAA